MKDQNRAAMAAAVAALVTASGVSSAQSLAHEIHETIMQDLMEHELWHRSGDELSLESLKFFIEFNETDEDVGVQCVLGGEPYKTLRAYDPDRRVILQIRPKHRLISQGLSDFFFESAEPTLDEFSMRQFLNRFPEGEYEFLTITLENELQAGDAEFTHNIPAGPEIVFPQDGDTVDPNDLLIEWEPVTMSTIHNPPQVPVDIVAYQVIVTRDDPKRVYDVTVPPHVTAISVPPEFFEEETEYELEIIAIEESDNQTISLLFFETGTFDGERAVIHADNTE